MYDMKLYNYKKYSFTELILGNNVVRSSNSYQLFITVQSTIPTGKGWPTINMRSACALLHRVHTVIQHKKYCCSIYVHTGP